jgi:hypothetical protein
MSHKVDLGFLRSYEKKADPDRDEWGAIPEEKKEEASNTFYMLVAMDERSAMGKRLLHTAPLASMDEAAKVAEDLIATDATLANATILVVRAACALWADHRPRIIRKDI